MSRLHLERRAQVEAQPTIGTLALGRAIDAAVRRDTEWFIADYPLHANPVQGVSESLIQILRPMGDRFADLVRKLESRDPVEVSVALELIHRRLVGETREQNDALEAVAIGSELLASLRPDAGLAVVAPARVLMYGALEAYYYRRATAGAKKRFDAFRGLIRAATGRSDTFVDQDEDLGTGMKVWEGWQAVRSLRALFGLADLAAEMEARRAFPLAALAHASDVILRMNEAPLDVDAVLRAINAVEHLAQIDERPNDMGATADLRAELEKVVRDQARSDALEGPSPVAPRSDRPPPMSSDREVHFLATELEQAPPKRDASTIVEDLTSVVDRLQILLTGDDNSLVFEVAPLLLTAMRRSYGELVRHHPELRQAIYAEVSASSPQSEREVAALRSLVERGAELAERFDQLAKALGTGTIDVGYYTDEIPAAAALAQARAEAEAEAEDPFHETTAPDPSTDPLDGVQLPESTVRGLEFAGDTLILELDLLLDPSHVRHRGDEASKWRERGKLCLERASRIEWRRVNVTPGAENLGRIETFDRDADSITIAGDFGEVVVDGAEVVVEFEDTM
jgi:hypothetical protein